MDIVESTYVEKLLTLAAPGQKIAIVFYDSRNDNESTYVISEIGKDYLLLQREATVESHQIRIPTSASENNEEENDTPSPPPIVFSVTTLVHLHDIKIVSFLEEKK